MLGLDGGQPVQIIEDVALAQVDPARLEKIFVMPLFVEGIDSAPVTILACLRDN